MVEWFFRKKSKGFRTGGTPTTAYPEYWNGSIPWVSAKDFNTFLFEDSEDHVTELALAEINAAKLTARSFGKRCRRWTELREEGVICCGRGKQR